MRRHVLQFGRMIPMIDDAGFPVLDPNTGEPVQDFALFKSAYGEANEVFGEQKYLAMQQYNSETIKFRTHYVEGLTSDMKIKFNNEFYEMVGPPDNVRYLNKELLIEAKRVIL